MDDIEVYPKAGRKGKTRKYLYCKIKCWDGRTREKSTGYGEREAAQAEARRMQAAENARAEALDEKTALDSVEGPTLADSLEVVLIRDETLEHISDSRVVDHANHGRNLVAFFGPWKRVLLMVPKDIRDYYAHRRACFVDHAQTKPISAHTIQKEIGTLKLARKLAMESGIRPRYENADLVPEGLFKSAYRPRETWHTVSQFEAMLAHLKPKRRDYCVMYVRTGIDRGPLHRLDPAHVRFSPPGSKVAGYLEIPDTKTASRRRKVPLHPDAAEVLRGRMHMSPMFPVWTNDRKELARACAKAGVPRVTPKDLRRTFCSWLANANVTEAKCAELMGHKDSTMVRHVYQQISSESQEAAVLAAPAIATGSACVSRHMDRARHLRVVSGPSCQKKANKG